MLGAGDWITPLWTTVAGAVIIILAQQTYKYVRNWQKTRRTVEVKDHDLLHQLADAFLGKKAGPFNKAEPGVFERLDTLDSTVNDMSGTVAAIWEKVK